MADNKAALLAELKKEFDTMTPLKAGDKKKKKFLSFSSDQIYIGLGAESAYDEKLGKYKDPTITLTTSFQGHFGSLPIDGKFWKEFAAFAQNMSEVLDGISIANVRTVDDVDTAKKMLAGFRGN